MRNSTVIILSAMFFLLLGVSASISQAQSPQETLNQYVSDLQSNPNNNELREKIIKLAQEMKPGPAIPEDAERYMVRGQAAFKDARDAGGYDNAIAEFEKASNAAPWVGNIYYNLGVVQDRAGRYEEAIKNLKLYLLASPDSPDVKKVKDLIYEVEYRKDKKADKAAATEELGLAIGNGNVDRVRALLNKGADVNKIGSGWVSPPLVMAVDVGNVDIVRLLLDNGADINCPKGYTPLMEAVRTGHDDIVRLLIDRNADLNGALGVTHEYSNREYIVRMLKDAGAKE